MTTKTPTAGRPRKVMLDSIEYEPQNQARVQLNNDTVAEYADAMARKEKLPPIVCYHDGSTYWLADGFHRYHAARKRGEKWIDAQVIKGSRDDARWHAAGANTQHGLNRTTADKQKAVRLALELRPNLSDRKIAEHCGVDHKTVAIQRAKSSGEIPQMDSPRAVRLALELRPSLSDRAIAQHCGVAVMTVGAVRRGESGVQNGHLPAQHRVGLDGKTYPARRPEPRAQATESPAEPSDPWEDSEGEDEPAAAPVRAAAAPAKPARVDGKGRVIPANIAEAFLDQRADVNEWLADFRAISERLLAQRKRRGYASIAWPEIEAALLRVANAVRAEALPYAVCPYCSGDGCDACKGNGWLPRAGWQCVAPELAGKD